MAGEALKVSSHRQSTLGGIIDHVIIFTTWRSARLRQHIQQKFPSKLGNKYETKWQAIAQSLTIEV